LIRKISHVGIAVSNLDAAVKLYSEVLGLKVSGIETIEEQKVKQTPRGLLESS
jgi:methylmalonyl-CoA/ethylmalonyl-CoA epimerase